MDTNEIQSENVIIFLASAALMTLSLLWILWIHRIFAFIVSKVLNFYFRRKYGKSLNQPVYFRVQSIYLAPLGGKILLKNLQYSTKDYSVYAIDCIIVISWWHLLRNLDSKLNIRMHGVECIIYDNSQLYDSIVKGGTDSNAAASRKRQQQNAARSRQYQANTSDAFLADGSRKRMKASFRKSSKSSKMNGWFSWLGLGKKDSVDSPVVSPNAKPHPRYRTPNSPVLEHNDDFISVTSSENQNKPLDRKRAKSDAMDMGLEDNDTSDDANHVEEERRHRLQHTSSTGTIRQRANNNTAASPRPNAQRENSTKSLHRLTKESSQNTPYYTTTGGNHSRTPSSTDSHPQYQKEARTRKASGSDFYTYIGLMRWVKNIKFIIKKGNLIIGNYKTPSYAQVGFKKSSGRFFLDELSSLNPESNLHMKIEDAKLRMLSNEHVNTNHKAHHMKHMAPDSIVMQDVTERYRELFNEAPYASPQTAGMQTDHVGRPIPGVRSDVQYPYGHNYPKKLNLKEVDQSTVFECSFVTLHYSSHIEPIYTPGIQYENPKQKLSLEFERFTNDVIVYGPWGDHQRTLIQEFFYPKTYKNLDRTVLQEGHTIGAEFFDIYIRFKHKTMWRLPFIRTPEREVEKERQLGKQELFDVYFDAGSSVHWQNPLLRSDSGSKIDVKIDFKNVEAVTSNTGEVWGVAERFEGRWEMRYAPEWNGPKEFQWDWNFTRGHMFYLWEHTGFIQDFIRDWSNWENAQEVTLREFIPSNYLYTFNFYDFHVYMCINPHNIIDSHNDMERNNYADIFIPHFQFQFALDYPKFNPECTDFVFDINLFSSESDPHNMPYMKIQLSDDHPLKPHLQGEDTTFLTGRKGFLHGVYTYNNKIRQGVLDTFRLDIDFYDVQGHLNGGYIRHFITWFINYFSYNNRHLTSEEFETNGYKNDKGRQIWLLQVTDENYHRFIKNDLEYYIVLNIHKGQGTLPLNLHSTHEEMATLFCEDVSLEARYLPQYLDLVWTIAPFTAEFPTPEHEKDSDSAASSSQQKPRRKYIGCTGMTGWGKMPTGPAPDHNFYYMDLDFQFGEIAGEISLNESRNVIAFLKNWVSQFTSAYAPSPYDNIDPVYDNREFVPAEVSKYRPFFVNVDIETVQVLLLAQKGNVNISVGEGISLDYSSLNDRETNSRIQLEIPHMEVEFLNSSESSRDNMMYSSGHHRKEYKSVGRMCSGILLRKHFRKPSVIQDFNLQQDFLRKHNAPDLFQTHYTKFDGPNNPYDDEDHNATSVAAAVGESALFTSQYHPSATNTTAHTMMEEGDSMVQEDISNVSDIDSYMEGAEEEAFHDPDSDMDTISDNESFMSFDSYSSGDGETGDIRSKSTDSRSHQSQRKPYVETVTGKKITLKDDVIKRIEEQLKELWNNPENLSQNNEDEDDDDLIFFKDEKTKHFKVSDYDDFLRTLELSAESDDVVSPLRFSSQHLPGVPHISSTNDSIGTYAYWPRVEIRDVTSSHVQDYHHIHATTNQHSSNAGHHHHTEQNRETIESVGEQCSFSHYSLHFVRTIDVFLTPHTVDMLGEIVCAIVTPVGQNISATCDDVENSSVKGKKQENNNTAKKDEPPEFPLSKITLSCSLSAVKVHILQAIRPPNMINSSLLKDLNTYSTKLVANSFFCAVSFSWKKELVEDKLKSELFSIDGSFTLESLRLVTQCLTKTKDIYRGISDFDLNEEVLKSVIHTHPVVLSGNAENISIKTIHRLGKHESQGRISCTSGKPIELFSTQEIPVVLFSMYEVWRHSIEKQINRVKKLRASRYKAKIILLAGIAKLKGEELSNAPTEINDQGDFVINPVENTPPEEAILDVRKKILELKPEEKELLRHWIDSVSSDSTSIKKLKQNVAFTHWSLVEDNTFAPHLQEQIKTSGSSLFDRKTRVDLFLSVQQLSFSIHAHSASSGRVKKSTGSIRNVDLRGQLELKTDKIQKRSTNHFLQTVTNTTPVKRRDISTIMNLNVDSIDVDVHPRAYELITVIAGIVMGLKSHRDMKKKGENLKGGEGPFRWLNKHASTTAASQDSSDSAQVRQSTSSEQSNRERQASRKSILPILDSTGTNKQVETSFHGFFNLLIGKVEARAWMARGINFAQLSFDKISLCLNKPLLDKGSSRHADKNSKLIECASGSARNIHFEYNYAPLPEEGTVVPDFISLFDTTVSNIRINQFYVIAKDKQGNSSEQIHILPEVGSIVTNIPYSDTWSAASLQFKFFGLDWWEVVKKKPNVKLPPKYEYTFSESSDGANSTISPKDASTTASFKLPSINVVIDVHDIQFLFMLLPTLQMRYSLSRVMAFFNREDSSYSSFRLHIFSNSLSFKTDSEESFPEQFNPQWTGSHVFGTGASETKNFKKLFILPEILLYGDFSMREERPVVNASVIVEYVENIITGDIINYIISVQSNIIKEISNILSILQNRIDKDEITERIRSELPRAQASVKNLNAYFNIDVFLEGLHFTAFSPATAVILDSGKIDVGVSRSEEGVKWSVDLNNSSAELVDLANFKWSDKKEFQGKYSNSKQCYKWASFSTNIHVENRTVTVASGEQSTEEAASPDGETQSATATSSQKFFTTISDTNVYIRPGCPQIALLMFRDYQEAVRNLISELKESRKHLNTEIFKQLIATGEEYYTYYSAKLVKSVTSDPTMLIYAGVVRVTNTTLAIPLGDNPYFGFLYNSNPSFSPTAVAHIILDSLDLTTRTLTEPSGKKKARGIIVLNNVYAYIDQCTKNDIKNQSYVPSMEKFNESSHRCELPDAYLGIDFNMDSNVMRAKVTATAAGPQLSVNPEILNHVLDMTHDWFSVRHQLHSSDDLLHHVMRKQIQTPRILTETEASVPFLKQKLHITCRLKVKAGQSKFHHTLDVPVQTNEKPVWASISEKADTLDPSVVAVATLPSFLIDVVHISPSLISLPSGGTSTHLQINVNWKGIRLDPKSVLFLNEGWFTYQEYSKRQKKLRQQRKWKLTNFDDYVKSEQCAKPERWMKYVNSAIMIQRLYRGYLTRKIIRNMLEKGEPLVETRKSKTHSRSKTHHSDSSDAKASAHTPAAASSFATNSISILCRVQPFTVLMTSSPVSDVMTSFEFSKPFDILFTRMHRYLHRRKEKGNALFNTVFLNAPQILVRMYNSLNPDEFLRFMISGVVANVGAGYGPLLRSDQEATISGTISIDKIKVQFNLPQISQLLLMYSLWMEKSAEAKQALASQISKVQNASRVRKTQTKDSDLALESTISKYGQLFIKKIEFSSDLDYMIGKQLVEVHSVSLFIRDRGRFLNSQTREPLHIGGYISRAVVKLSGRLSGSIHASGLTVGLDHEFAVGDPKHPVNRGKTNLRVRILPVDLSIDYNMDKIITLYSESFFGQFKDVFDSEDGLLNHIQSKFSLETLILRLSSLAAPAFVHIFYSILDTLKNRRNNALKVLQRSTFYYHRDSILSDDEIEKDIRTIKQLKVRSPVEQFRDFNILGNVTVFGSNINIFLHDRFKLDEKNQLREMDGRLRGDYTSFGVEEFQVKYVRNAREEPDSTLENPKFKVLRKVQLFLLKADIDRNTVSSQRISLIRVPGGSIVMKSKQANYEDTIQYEFSSRFPDSITVSTNLAEYTFFRKLLGFYQESVKKELSLKKSHSSQDDDFSFSNASDEQTETSTQSNEPEGPTAASLLNQNFSGVIHFNPRLDVLGDMTPSVETVLGWLGIKDRSFVAKLTHVAVSNSLEAFLIGCKRTSDGVEKLTSES